MILYILAAGYVLYWVCGLASIDYFGEKYGDRLTDQELDTVGLFWPYWWYREVRRMIIK